MLGRGVKRKWSFLEEPEADTVPAAATEEEEGGQEEDGFLLGQAGSDVSHLQQRQLVLGLSLEKLQSCQAGMELSLRRSVLLINTLRQIQEDMRRDGAGNCTPDVSNSRLDVPLDGINLDSRLLRDAIREDMPVTCPGCAEGDREGPSHPSLSAVFTPHEETSPSGQTKSLPATTHTAFSDAANAMGYLSDLALDDIFEDIDTSMCEASDLISFWPVSVSFWGDEEGKMCSAGLASAGTLQSCLMDSNELDHIMEILVKS